MNLRTHDPERFRETKTPWDLLRAIEAQPCWDALVIANTEYLLAYWASKALATSDTKLLEALSAVLPMLVNEPWKGPVCPVPESPALALALEAHRNKWGGYLTLVDMRILFKESY